MQGMLGNYLAIGPELNELHGVWATVERNPVGPNTLGAEEVAEFIDSLESGGPPAAVRWLSDYLPWGESASGTGMGSPTRTTG